MANRLCLQQSRIWDGRTYVCGLAAAPDCYRCEKHMHALEDPTCYIVHVAPDAWRGDMLVAVTQGELLNYAADTRANALKPASARAAEYECMVGFYSIERQLLASLNVNEAVALLQLEGTRH